MQRARHQGLKAVRFLMVLSSVSPLFILWAIRGCALIPDAYLIILCLAFVAFPAGIIGLRVRSAVLNRETRVLSISRSSDCRDQLLVYLFAMLLPLYTADLNTWRSVASAGAAVVFIIVIFYQLNLHYMNLLTILFSFNVFTVRGSNVGEIASDFVLITRRGPLRDGEQIIAYRISDTVYLEATSGT